MYFCKDDRRLFAYEQLMQQPPFYTPRRSGLQITDKEDLITQIWGEKGAKMISELKRSDFLSRMYQVCGTKEWRTAFRSHKASVHWIASPSTMQWIFWFTYPATIN